jgi:hypothetical protein
MFVLMEHKSFMLLEMPRGAIKGKNSNLNKLYIQTEFY